MAYADDLRERVVAAVLLGGMSRNAAARRFSVSVPSAVRWVTRFLSTGKVSPAPTGGDHRSGRIEAQSDYLRIPTQSGHRFRFEAGHPSETKPATVPK